MNRKVGVAFSALAIVFELVSTLILTPYLVSTLGSSEFGVYKMCLSITGYVLLLDLGIGNSVIRFASKFRSTHDKQSENGLAGVSLAFYLAVAFLALVLGFVIMAVFPYVFGKGLSDEEVTLGQKLVLITAITSSITLCTSGFYNIIIAHERFSISKGLSIIQVAIKIPMSFLALKLGFGSVGVCLINLFLTFLVRSFFVVYAIIRLQIHPSLKKCDSSFVKEILCYSSLIAIQMVATQVNQSVDQILIGALVPVSSSLLGVYAVGAQINQYFMSMGAAITGVLLPGIVKFVEDKPNSQEITKEMTRISRIIAFPLSLIYVGFILLGKPFIFLWMGFGFEEAYYVALILITAQLFVSILSPVSQLLWARNQHKEISWTKLVIVLANCFLTVALIKWNPLFGASLGTMISTILGDVILLLVIAGIKTKIDTGKFIHDTISGIAIALLGLSFFAQRYFDVFYQIYDWKSFVIAGFAFAFATAVCYVLFCANNYEKQMLSQLFRLRISKRG